MYNLWNRPVHVYVPMKIGDTGTQEILENEILS